MGRLQRDPMPSRAYIYGFTISCTVYAVYSDAAGFLVARPAGTYKFETPVTGFYDQITGVAEASASSLLLGKSCP